MSNIVRTEETAFNIRLNNRRQNLRYFQQQSHNFKNDAKFIVIVKLFNTSNPKGILRERLNRKRKPPDPSNKNLNSICTIEPSRSI